MMILLFKKRYAKTKVFFHIAQTKQNAQVELGEIVSWSPLIDYVIPYERHSLYGVDLGIPWIAYIY